MRHSISARASIPIPKTIAGDVPWLVDLHASAKVRAALRLAVPMLSLMTPTTGAAGAIVGPLQLHNTGWRRASRTHLVVDDVPYIGRLGICANDFRSERIPRLADGACHDYHESTEPYPNSGLADAD